MFQPKIIMFDDLLTVSLNTKIFLKLIGQKT